MSGPAAHLPLRCRMRSGAPVSPARLRRWLSGRIDDETCYEPDVAGQLRRGDRAGFHDRPQSGYRRRGAVALDGEDRQDRQARRLFSRAGCDALRDRGPHRSPGAA